MGTRKGLLKSRVLTEWAELVGPKLSSRTRPYSITDRILVIEVASSAWLHELTMLKAQLLDALHQRMGAPRLFDDLEFKLARLGGRLPTGKPLSKATADDIALELGGMLAPARRAELRAIFVERRDRADELAAHYDRSIASLDSWTSEATTEAESIGVGFKLDHHARQGEPDQKIIGRALAELDDKEARSDAAAGLFFPLPRDKDLETARSHALWDALEKLDRENGHEYGKLPELTPEAVWDARFNRLGDSAYWLLTHNRDLFLILERVALRLRRGALASQVEQPRTPGRPRRPEKHLDEIASRLALLRRDDEARSRLRQAVSTCVDGASAHHHNRRVTGAERPSREQLRAEAQARAAAYWMLREELDMTAMGARLPPLTNVLLVMLEDAGCDRVSLVKAAVAAGVLQGGRRERTKLADRLGPTRKALAALRPDMRVLVERSAWWDAASMAAHSESVDESDGATALDGASVH
jgi:hypothetical protein